MQMLDHRPDKAYRKIELDARVEASSGADLTIICLEEVIAALGQALIALERNPHQIPTEPLTRAHGIAVWLARSVAPENPMREAITQFYGGLATRIGRNMRGPLADDLAAARGDYDDLLKAAIGR